MTKNTDVDVAVIGCGTTGLALARLLEMEGLRVAVVDRSAIPIPYPRATHLDDETMRTFQTLGLQHLEQDFSAAGTYRHYDSKWNVVREFNWSQELTDQGWRADYQFHQPDFESVLRGYTHSDARTIAYYGWIITALDDTGDDVTITVRETATGEESEIKASFAVGCDGARSPVRGMIGAGQVDHHGTHRSLIVDIFPLVEKDTLPGREAFIQGGIRNPLTLLTTQEPRVRIEQMLRPDDDTAEFERTEHAYELIAPWLDPHEYRILRCDVYEWHSLTADPWRIGRVFIAGDAAHTMPPHLGQGMCSGIRDSMNLAWKLGRVVRGESPPALLDTYESERRPHVTTYTEIAAMMANEIEAMEEASAGDEHPVIEVHAMRPKIGPGVHAEDGDGLAATLSAQPELKDGSLLDDVVGYRFVLVGDAETIADTSAETKALLKSLNASAIVADSEQARDWMEGAGATAVLIRPDRYVFGSANSSAEVDALVSRLDAALRAAVPTP